MTILRNITLLGLVLLAALYGAPPAPARTAPQVPAFDEEVSVAWVLVPVSVRSGKGEYVRGLEQDDFTLLVDGEAVPIESFHSESGTPVSLVWLQDLSGSMSNGGKLDASRWALDYFLDRMGPEDSFAIATFAGGRLAVEVPFTADLGALGEAMDLWQGYGTTALYDAVAWAPDVTAEAGNHKRAVVLVTDGADNASTLDPAAARYLVRQARLPVYVLGLDTETPAERDEQGEAVYRFAHLLDLLARASGGRFYSVPEPEDVATAARAIHEEITHQYVLGFQAHDGGDREYRALEVRVEGVKKPELVHREGYRGGPPASLASR